MELNTVIRVETPPLPCLMTLHRNVFYLRAVCYYGVLSDHVKNSISVFCWLDTFEQWSPAFDPRTVHLKFVVGQVALGLFFLRGFQFSSLIVIPPTLHTHPSVTDVL